MWNLTLQTRLLNLPLQSASNLLRRQQVPLLSDAGCMPAGLTGRFREPSVSTLSCILSLCNPGVSGKDCIMTKHKHLTLSDRIRTEQGLGSHMSFRAIARSIGKDNSTISKEIHQHIVFKQSGCFGNCFNDCINRFSCTCRMLCTDPDCRNTFCKNCIRCRKLCDSYEKQIWGCRINGNKPLGR